MTILKSSLICICLLVTSLSYTGKCCAVDRKIRDFAFGEDNSWVIVYDTNNRRLAKHVRTLDSVDAHLKELSRNNESLTGIGLDGKNGWYALSETAQKFRMKYHNPYAAAKEKVEQLTREGWQVKDVALTSSGGYVVVYGRSGWHQNGNTYSGDIPQSLKDELGAIREAGGWVSGVGISPDGSWAVAYSHDGGCWHFKYSGGLPGDFVTFIRQNFNHD